MSRIWTIAWIGFAVLAALTILLATGVISGFSLRAPKVELAFWGFESEDAWQNIIAAYKKEHPEVTVAYRQLNPANYETELVNGLATGNGPDIFAIGNSWLPKHGNKIFPAPDTVADVPRVRAVFPHVVEQEFTRGNAVYALPVTLDTLALLYNKSIFDAQGIALPPGNWLAFQDLAQSLGKGSAAIGGSGRTIERAADIISVLMLQDRVPMADEQGNVVLQGAQGALAFYAKFGSAKGKYGVWDNASPSAFTRFAAGTLPMAFGYYADLRALRAANPQLRAGAAPLPQPASGSVNYARYHGLAVWSQSKNPEAAWRFIATVTMDPRFAAMYSGAANTPPALRELIAQVANDPELGAFALQALSARAWPRPDDRIVDAAFTQMIESIHKGGAPLKDALDAAERAINSFAYPFQ